MTTPNDPNEYRVEYDDVSFREITVEHIYDVCRRFEFRPRAKDLKKIVVVKINNVELVPQKRVKDLVGGSSGEKFTKYVNPLASDYMRYLGKTVGGVSKCMRSFFPKQVLLDAFYENTLTWPTEKIARMVDEIFALDTGLPTKTKPRPKPKVAKAPKATKALGQKRSREEDLGQLSEDQFQALLRAVNSVKK